MASKAHEDKSIALAKRRYSRACSRWGEGSSQALQMLFELGCTYSNCGDHEKAVELMETARSAYIKAEPTDDAYAICMQRNLAAAYYSWKKEEETLRFAESAYHDGVDKLGHDHPQTIESLGFLRYACYLFDKMEDSLRYSELYRTVCRDVYGDKSVEALEATNFLVHIGRRVCGCEEFFPLAQKNYMLCQKVLGDCEHVTMIAARLLAVVYDGLDKTSVAINLLERAYSEAVGIDDEMSDSFEEESEAKRMLLGQLLVFLRDEEDYEKMAEYEDEARSEFSSATVEIDEGRFLMCDALADYYIYKKEYARAFEYAENAYRFARANKRSMSEEMFSDIQKRFRAVRRKLAE